MSSKDTLQQSDSVLCIHYMTTIVWEAPHETCLAPRSTATSFGLFCKTTGQHTGL